MRLRFLLRPGWLAATLAVFAFAVACYTLLAPWQFSRHAERAATNDAVRASFGADPIAVDRLLPNGAAPGPGTEWRLVTVTGTYLADAEVVARLRTVQGEAAFEVLTPFRQADGSIVLVDRGFLRPVQTAAGIQVPNYPRPPGGPVELVGRARVDESDPNRRDELAGSTTGGRPQVYAVDSHSVGRVTGLPIRPGYLQLDAGQPGVLGPLPLPQLDAGPFLSYALQWIAFATMALGAWAYFTIREIRPGGALSGPREQRPARRSVAQRIAEEEAEERAAEARASSAR